MNGSGFVLRLLVLLCVSDLLIPMSQAIWLNLPATGTKCVSEEIQNNVVVLADYVVIPDDHGHPSPTISVKVCFLFALRFPHFVQVSNLLLTLLGC